MKRVKRIPFIFLFLVVMTTFVIFKFDQNVWVNKSKMFRNSRIDVDPCHALPRTLYNSSNYVSLCRPRMYGNHRVGNHLFMLAAMLFVAQNTGRSVIMKSSNWCLDDLFKMDCLPRFSGNYTALPGPVRNIKPVGKYKQSYDQITEKGVGLRFEKLNFTERTLGLCGLYQTSVFADAVNSTLRQLLQFRPEVKQAAEYYLDAVRPKAWLSSPFTRVGMHVRRGDFLNPKEVRYGLTTITKDYFNHAVQYFTRLHQRVQLVIATDDPLWVTTTVREIYNLTNVSVMSHQSLVHDDNIVITLSNNSAAVDFALLTMCDSVIVSTGSFGWWAAWLANKPTVYYAEWPRTGSILYKITDVETFFPRDWHPMI